MIEWLYTQAQTTPRDIWIGAAAVLFVLIGSAVVHFIIEKPHHEERPRL